MARFITFLFCLVLTNICSAQEKITNIWYTPVQKPATVWDPYYYDFAPDSLAADLAYLLNKSTGLIYKAVPYDGKSTSGIFLLLDTTKNNLANEAAIVYSDGKSCLKITARYATGLSYAMYSYLEKAGFKFYLPGEKWTVIPSLNRVISYKINNEVWQPYFKVRTFFPSGAMPAVKNLDPDNHNRKEWNTWYRRNRMGSEYIVMGGHIGESFNIENKKEIEKDSMILAPVNGRRVYNQEAKLDPTYAKGVNLFIDWIAQQYKNDNSRVPAYIPVKKYQSVDPGDALNYCYTPECRKLFPSVSDQVFTIANRAADRFKKIYPGAGVNLYAYTERAEVPAVKIADNVHVCIVASGFQNTGTPAGLIDRWSKKTSHTSIYDYLNIPVWNKDEPFFDLDDYFNYLNFIKEKKVEGFTFESGASSIASGVVQYFILKYLCTPYADVQKEFDRFCNDMFGNAAGPVKKMMLEWYFSSEKIGHTYEHVTFNEVELGRFVNYLQQADATNGLTAAQKERVHELKAYVVYLAKYFELRGDIENLYVTADKNSFIKNKTDEILKYTWMLYPTLIFHNTQLTDVLKSNFAGDAAFVNKWDYYSSTVFKDITRNADNTVDREFAKTWEKYHLRAAPYYADEEELLTKAYPYRADTVNLKLIDGSSFKNYHNNLHVYCYEPTSIRIHYKALTAKNIETRGNNIGYIAVIKDDYSYISEQTVMPGKTEATVTFTLATKGKYTLYLGQSNETDYDYQVLPGKSILYLNKFVIPMNGLKVMDNAGERTGLAHQLAFYTANADSINYSMIYPDKINSLTIYNSKGVKKTMTVNALPYHMAAKLNEDEKNSFMYFTNDVFRWPPAFKTIPNYFFFFKQPAWGKK